MKPMDIMEALGEVPAETAETALAETPKRRKRIIRRRILRIAAAFFVVLIAGASFRFLQLRAVAKNDPVLEILGVDRSSFTFKLVYPLKIAQRSDVCVNFSRVPFEMVSLFENDAGETVIYDSHDRLTSYHRSSFTQTIIENPLSEEEVTAIATDIAAKIDPRFALVRSGFNAGGFPDALYYFQFHKPVGRDAFDALTLSILLDGTICELTQGVCNVPASYTDDKARAKLAKYIEEVEDPRYMAQYAEYYGYEISEECAYEKVGWHVYAFYTVDYLLDEKGVVRDAVQYIVRD